MAGETTHLEAGQNWRFHAPQGFEDARIIIGAIVTPTVGDSIVCFSVSRAPCTGAGGVLTDAMISLIPMSATAFRATVVELDGTAALPSEFSDELSAWQNDPRGLTVFTVPFDGCLDRLLTNQAASLIAQSAA